MKSHGVWRGFWRRQSTERGEGELRGGWSSMQSTQKCLDAETPGCKAPKISPGQPGRSLPSRAMPPHFAPSLSPPQNFTPGSQSPLTQVWGEVARSGKGIKLFFHPAAHRARTWGAGDPLAPHQPHLQLEEALGIPGQSQDRCVPAE